VVGVPPPSGIGGAPASYTREWDGARSRSQGFRPRDPRSGVAQDIRKQHDHADAGILKGELSSVRFLEVNRQAHFGGGFSCDRAAISTSSERSTSNDILATLSP
jgi:hypothetical protein